MRKNVKVYYCNVLNNFESTSDDFIINSVNGTHKEKMTNLDVRGFFISGEMEDKIVKVFPSNLSSFFPNLQRIHVKSCGLEKIDTENLQNFPNLIYLNLYYNKIKRLEQDLFKFNPKLSHITLESNLIEFIDYNEFDGLKKLTNLNLDRNKCIKDDAMGNRKKVLKLIEKIKEKCSKKNILEVYRWNLVKYTFL